MHSVQYFCTSVIKFEFSIQIFTIVVDIEFHRNPSSWSHADKSGPTETTKIIGAFRVYANVPINESIWKGWVVKIFQTNV
jgi:hypothetical protein